MTIKWNLPNIMYEKGVFSAADLRKLLREKGNLDISAPAVHRLVNGLPQEYKITTLDALCAALECDLQDIVLHEKPTTANHCVQPLVLESGFKPPRQRKKQKKEKTKKIDLPPI